MLTWMHDRPLPTVLDKLMLAMPYLGTNLTMLPLMIVVALVLWLRFHQRLIAVQLLLVSVGSLSLNPTMKTLLDRPRPDMFPLRGMWTWAAYPSGHLILTTALYFTVSLILDRIYGWKWPYFVTVVVILLTAYSRVYLSVHWPTDMVGGLLIGLVWLFGTWMAFVRAIAGRSSQSVHSADDTADRTALSNQLELESELASWSHEPKRELPALSQSELELKARARARALICSMLEAHAHAHGSSSWRLTL